MSIPAAISTAGLTKHYPGVQALDDRRSRSRRAIYGFLGPNGAGKTTALKLLAGLIRPTRGTASVGGIPISAGPHYRTTVGYLSQDPRFYGWMSGRETLRYIGSLYPANARPDRGRCNRCSSVSAWPRAADRKVKTYSGGMRQRLGIAQALVARPAVLLLDEPVSSRSIPSAAMSCWS